MTSSPAVGERWVYREKKGAPYLEAEIIEFRLGATQQRHQAKVLLPTGPPVWVPAGRLKALWSEVDRLIRSDELWASLMEHGRPEQQVRFAAWDVLTLEFGDDDVEDRGGVLSIRGSVDLPDMPEASDAFEEDGWLHLPWPVAEAMVREIAPRHADVLAERIQRQEQDAWSSYARRLPQYEWQWMSFSPEERSAAVAALVGTGYSESWAAIRDWIGVAALERAGKVADLESKLLTARAIAFEAIEALHGSGDRSLRKVAKQLRSRLESGGSRADA